MVKRIIVAVCACTVAGALAAQTPAKSAQATSMAKPKVVHKDTPASLQREAKISMAAARATALKEVPNGKINSAELERENGRLIYSFDIKVAGKTGIEEVNVNAMTGAIVAHEHETPKAEAKEAVKEKKEKK